MSLTKGSKQVLNEKIHEKKKTIMKELLDEVKEDVRNIQECIRKKKIA